MNFDFGTFFFGVFITIAGILLVRFYKEVSDNFVGGVGSYDKVKLVGLGVTVFGILFAFKIPQLIIVEIVKLFFPGV